MVEYEQIDIGRSGSARPVWANRNFLILIFSQTLSRVGLPATALATKFIAVTLYAAGPFQIGVLLACETAPYALFSIISGVVADRISKKDIIILCDLCRGLILISFCGALYFGIGNIYLLCFTVFVLRSVDTLFEVTFQSVVPQIVGRTRIIDGNSALEFTGQTATMVGNTLGGMLLAIFGPMLALALDAATFIVSAILTPLISLPKNNPDISSGQSSIWQDLRSGFRTIINDRELIFLLGFSMWFGVMMYALSAISFLMLYNEIGFTITQIGVIFTCIAAGGAVAAAGTPILAAKFKYSTFLFLLVILRIVACVILLAVNNTWGMICVCLSEAIAYAAHIAYTVVAGSYAQRIVSQDVQGRVFGFTRFITWGALPLGAIMGGALAEVIGVRGTVSAIIAILIISFISLFLKPVAKIRSSMILVK